MLPNRYEWALRVPRYSNLKKFMLTILVSLLTVSTSMSDDIDVYVAASPAATQGDTLVVFTLDVRPNVMASQVCNGGECNALFNEVGMGAQLDGSISFFELLVAALKKVLRSLDNHKIKVALMLSHANTTGGNKKCVGFQGENIVPDCSNGAYVLSAFKSVGDNPNTAADESLELNEFFEKLESIPLKDGANWSHPYQLKELFFEMFRYVTARRVYNGQNGRDDFGTGNKNTLNIDHVADTISVNPIHNENPASPSIAELKWDVKAQKNVGAEKFYEHSLDTSGHCSSIFSVNMTFANASQDSDSDAEIAQAPPRGFGFDPDNSGLGELQVLRYLANTDLDANLIGNQNIISYFVVKSSSGGGGSVSRANDWAQAGGTGSALVATDNPDELVRLLSGVFIEILGVSTTFVAASVPANVFNRAETLNEIFLAIFEPNENGKPFWVGNVKKLTTTIITETVFKDIDGDGTDEAVTEDRKILVDVLEAGNDEPTSAINPLDGRIRANALTYWTRTGAGNAFLSAPVTEEDELEFAEGTDGRKVNRGGAGQVKPGYLGSGSPGESNTPSATTTSGPRRILTEPDSATDGPPSDGLIDLDGSASNSVAVELLEDSRPYPDSNVSYGDFLFRTVMSDCPGCASYSVATSTQRDTARIRVTNLVRFARGFDVSLNTALNVTAGKRSWWQADPLHTRPLALNYGARSGFSDDRPDIRVIVAGNDGMVQMIRDGRRPDGSEDGVEAWAFLPREFVPLQKRLMEGQVGLYKPGQPVASGDPPRSPLHPYSMDGAPTALVVDNDLDGTIETGDDDKVYLFFGQRRGGKRYYALDISDPDEPRFLWSIGKSDTDDEFAELGQSWSLLRAGIMRVDESGTEKRRPVLIFSGGYNGDDNGDGYGDLGKDSRVKNANSNTDIIGTDDDEGNALFIVNALTGALIWKAVGPPAADGGVPAAYDSPSLTLKYPDLVDSIAASPTVVDGNGDGLIDRVYFPDTGGNVWRVDAGDSDRANWTVTKLFSAGRHFQNDSAYDQRFFNATDVVFAKDAAGDFDAVILASGDRARPLGADVQNWIYMIKDRSTISGVPPGTTLTPDDLADLTDNCLQGDPDDFSGCTDASAETNIANGWKVQLEQCEAGGTSNTCGEKSLASALTIEGTVFLTTYLPVLDTVAGPTPSTCGAKEGAGLFYALDLQNAAGVLDFDPANNTNGVETPDRFDTLSSPGIPPEVVAISPDEVLRPDLTIQKTEGRKSGRTFWYERRFY